MGSIIRFGAVISLHFSQREQEQVAVLLVTLHEILMVIVRNLIQIREELFRASRVLSAGPG